MHLRTRKILVDIDEDDPETSTPHLSKWKPSKDNSFLTLCRNSTIHGVKYIGYLKSHFCERLFWGIVLIASSVVAFLSILNVLDRFNRSPIVVSYQPQEITLDEIPFPAITICNNNLLRMSAMGVVYEQWHKPVKFSQSEADRMIQLAIHFCKSYPQSLSTRFNYTAPPLPPDMNIFSNDFYEKELTANISVEALKVVLSATQKCDEMILRCHWRNKAVNCSQLFVKVETDAGTCCHFNGIPEEILQYKEQLMDPNINNSTEFNTSVIKTLAEKWISWKIDDNFNAKHDDDSDTLPPLRGKKAGKDSALSILVNPELDEYYCPLQDSTGFTLLAGSPIDHPEMSGFGIGIGPNSENFVDVSPELTMADSNINDLPLSKRLCYFYGEFTLKFFTHYTIRNCRNECVTNITLESCGCVRVYMAKDTHTKICGSVNNTCAIDVQRMMRTEGFGTQCKQCYPSCTSINYSVGLSKLPINPHKNPWKVNESFTEPWAAKNLSIIHVYFGSESIYSKYRQRVYDFSSLLSNAGGLLGLYFGFSVVSILEVFYHFMFKPLFEQSEDGKYSFPQKLKAVESKIREKFSSETNDHQTDDVIQKIFVKSKMNGNSSYPQWTFGEIIF